MKRITVWIVIVCLITALVGCSADSPKDTASTQASSETTTEKPAQTESGSTPSTEVVTTDNTFDFSSKTVRLNSGHTMPILGLGTWTLSNDEAENSVFHALKDGYRLIDTARYYRCEVGVGKGVRRAINEGIVTREEVFITSKIMPSDYERASQGIDDSLADLGMDYVDLMLIHQPGSNDEAVYKAMEQAVRDGKVRSIGISNYYTPEAFDEVMSYAEITPAVIQNESTVSWSSHGIRSEAEDTPRKTSITKRSRRSLSRMKKHPRRSSSDGICRRASSRYPDQAIPITLRKTTTSLTSN